MFLNKPINLKFKPPGKYAGWRLLSIVLVGLLLSTALFTFYFIYNNIYATMADANAVLILNTQLGGEAIDQAAYEKAVQLLAVKNTPFVIPTTTRDIFDNRTITMYEQTTSTSFSTNTNTPKTP